MALTRSGRIWIAASALGFSLIVFLIALLVSAARTFGSADAGASNTVVLTALAASVVSSGFLLWELVQHFNSKRQ